MSDPHESRTEQTPPQGPEPTLPPAGDLADGQTPPEKDASEPHGEAEAPAETQTDDATVRAHQAGEPEAARAGGEAPTAEQPSAVIGAAPFDLALGVQIGTTLGLALFAGLYSLWVDVIRMPAILFLAGITFAVAGGLLSALARDVHLLHLAHKREPTETPSHSVAVLLWDGLSLALGILLGVLPLALVASIMRGLQPMPVFVHLVGAGLLVAVGVVRSPSLRALPATVAYALLPAAAAVFAGHFLGDRLCQNMDWL